MFTLPTTDLKAAERFAIAKNKELEEQAERQATGLPDAPRVSEWFDQFDAETVTDLAPGAQRSYRDSLKPLRGFFVGKMGDPTIDKLRIKDVKAFRVWRRTRRMNGTGPVSARTVNKDVAVLHRILNLAEEGEYREGNPARFLDPLNYDAREPVILSDEEYERLLAACAHRPMLWLYVLTLGETGARCQTEALRLKWEDVDLAGGFVKIVSGRDGHRTKSGKSRWVPLTPRLADAFRAHMARFRMDMYKGKRSEWVFHHVADRRNAKAGDRIAVLRHAFKSAAARANIPADLNQHDLRHRRATAWLAAGKNPVHVKEALGHADLRTTMLYTHLAREHLRSLVDSPAPPADRKATTA
jgi:integrase